MTPPPPRWADALAYWEQDQRISGRSAETTRTWRSYLRRYAAHTDPMAATHIEVRAWIDANPGWSPSTHKSARSALSSFYRLAKAEGWVRRNPMKRVPPVAQRPGLPRPATEAQVTAGLRAWDPDTRLMVALAAECGLRRSEVAAVHERDLHDHGLYVRGKGGRQRWVPVPDPAVWRELASRRGWMFPGRFAGHLHPATVAKHVKAAAAVPPHPLRHRYATRAYDGTGDLLAVQQLLGHASVATTQVYVGVSPDRLRGAAGATLPTRRLAA